MTYSIFEGNMDRLKNKLTRIKNKCQRYGCDFHFEEVGEEFRELEDERKHKYIARFVIVDVDGLAVINDWKFVAAVEHTENGNVIRSTGEVEVPEKYYTSQPVCEHCGINRYRKDTYIVMNVKTGEFKQVGKSCLNDFTRGMSAESAAQYTSLFNELIEGETPTEGCAYEKYYDVGRFLRYAAETVRHFGYVKYDPDDVYARTTKIRAEEYYDVDSEVFMSEEKRKRRI